MPRDGSGNFTLPANTQAVSGDPISSTKFNTLVQDLEADANTDRPIVAGGTGASTASAARTNLGLAIGTDVQAFDAGLLSIAGLTTAADQSIYTTASDTYAVYTLTAAGRAILDDADASAQRTTLGLGTAATVNTGTSGATIPLLNAANTWSARQTINASVALGFSSAPSWDTNTYIWSEVGFGARYDGFQHRWDCGNSRTEGMRLSSGGVLTVSGNTVWHAGNDGTGSGLDADLLDGVQPSAFALTILDDADASAVRATIGAGIGDMLKSDNLSGLTNYATARTNLGLAIGTDVQAFDATLTALAGLATGADKLAYSTGTDTFAQADFTAFGRSLVDDADASAARTTLGLANGATTTISAFALTMLDDVDAAAVRTTIGVGLGTGDLVAANNLSDVANASTARTNLGLAIGTNVQAFDQQLQDIAALAVTDGGFIVGNGSTFVLETDATARTSLGLGTAAVVNTGTSGATIPLLNAANTFSAAQTFTSDSNVLAGGTGTFPGFQLKNTTDSHLSLGFGFDTSNRRMFWNRWNTSTGAFIENVLYIQQDGVIDFVGATTPRIGGNAIWHAGNDGAGSGLDADTLDGVEGSAYAALAGTQTFTGAKTFSADVLMSTFTKISFFSSTYYIRAFTGLEINSADQIRFLINDVAYANINNTGFSARTQAASETTGTLTVASANKTIQATGDITIPNAVFAAGDIILIYAGASARTITEGASVTMRLGGTATTGSRTLAARGVAVLFFVSSSEVVVSGGAVT